MVIRNGANSSDLATDDAADYHHHIKRPIEWQSARPLAEAQSKCATASDCRQDLPLAEQLFVSEPRASSTSQLSGSDFRLEMFAHEAIHHLGRGCVRGREISNLVVASSLGRPLIKLELGTSRPLHMAAAHRFGHAGAGPGRLTTDTVIRVARRAGHAAAHLREWAPHESVTKNGASGCSARRRAEEDGRRRGALA